MNQDDWGRLVAHRRSTAAPAPAPAQPPHAHQRNLLGSGGSLAFSLHRLGVFTSTDMAKIVLNGEITDDAHGITDDAWDATVMTNALAKKGFVARELDLATARWVSSLHRGSFIMDGILNRQYVNPDGGEEVKQDPTDSLPDDPSAWCHTIAVQNGRILEQMDRTLPIEALWLTGDPAMPDLGKGYLRQLDRVFRVEKTVPTREEEAAKFAAELAERKAQMLKMMTE